MLGWNKRGVDPGALIPHLASVGFRYVKSLCLPSLVFDPLSPNDLQHTCDQVASFMPCRSLNPVGDYIRVGLRS